MLAASTHGLSSLSPLRGRNHIYSAAAASEESTRTSASSATPFLQRVAQLHPPSAFDFDNHTFWSTHLLLYEDYSYATGIYAAPPEVQVRSML
ncbi:hypothetical protein HPB50_012080 [Hyalomma asiaticum]|uniref:Uncharacterized protein n=1 Tax=Hyalomma asiaticum TaxID=266040 RepID=A0ACB7RZI0_HYAAI|nr:hypothetical protein HPB50_012080 [Hyalomma asiaticum]